MAGTMDSLQDTLTCPVCFEEFEENGNHVPRLLPCSHTLCHTCIGQWIRNNRLECPTCRMKHEARNEEISFPQNKYILTMMRRRPTGRDEFRKCSNHEEDEVLFCRETGCQKTICILCLSEGHFGHKTVALKHETKDVLAKLLNSIEITIKKLNVKIKNIEDITQDATKKTETSLLQIKKEKDGMIQRLNKERDETVQRLNKERDEMVQRLEKKKEEMIKQYDGMTRQAEGNKIKFNEASGNDLTAMRDNAELLNTIKETVEEGENTHEDALKMLDTVGGVTENAEHLPRTKTYQYSEYIPGQKNLVGKLIKKEKSFLPHLPHVPAPELQGRVRQNINTGIDMEYSNYLASGIATLYDGTVAVYGTESGGPFVAYITKNKKYKLNRFSLDTGRELSSVGLAEEPLGMTEVQLGGRSTVAVSYALKSEIEFRNTEHLNEILLNYSVAPDQPGVLCAISTSMLVYVDRAIYSRLLHWLDCSEPEPKLLGITANTNLTTMKDMCTIKLENETLLIVISRDANESIHANNSSTGQLKWSVQKKIPSGTFKSYSVAGDGNGRLFVADVTNKCIQMFSASDGQYLGCFMNKGDQGLGTLYRLRWCEATSSLVVAHHVGGTCFISDIH